MKIGTPGPVSFPKDHQFGLLLIKNSGRAGTCRYPQANQKPAFFP
jgi:hypothetical protein